MKTYLVFLNEPHSIVNEYTAKNKRDALNQYNADKKQAYKITSDKLAPLMIVEKNAWYHYNFRAISYAAKTSA